MCCRARMMLPDLGPVPRDDILELQRRGADRSRSKLLPRSLALGPLYGFRFAAARSFRSAVKPMTMEVKVELIERRPLWLVD